LDRKDAKDRVEMGTTQIIKRKPVREKEVTLGEMEATAEHAAQLEANLCKLLLGNPEFYQRQAKTDRREIPEESGVQPARVSQGGPILPATGTPARLPATLAQPSPIQTPPAENQTLASLNDELQWMESEEATIKEQESRIRERKAVILSQAK
jgi:hypothetical protein